jgi:hypothetical protein
MVLVFCFLASDNSVKRRRSQIVYFSNFTDMLNDIWQAKTKKICFILLVINQWSQFAFVTYPSTSLYLAYKE